MRFRFINTGYNNAAMNMAIDEALLESKLPVLRVYSWKPAAISIGYNQNLQKEINIEECKQFGIDIVRRPTGGKAVLHDMELTYSVIIDVNSHGVIPDEHKDSILESYKIISKGILNALQYLGINTVMKDTKPVKTDTAICFNEPSWYEILAVNKNNQINDNECKISAKKLIGSAQRRINGKILQHGAILIDCNIEKMCRLFNTNYDDAVKVTKERVTSIRQLTKKSISFQTLANALKHGFEKNFNLNFADDNLTQDELAAATKLYKEKYNTEKWNLNI